ncbi:MAG: hypothetical protein RMK18_06760 [Armatimonadota bacterium]|nr:YbjN domain-containing protein [Armatimonadota bacterium]MCX7777540.1 YbjN domain-containing protein [Armatimonadota bacterium]MDW8025549.1 hypothetical protein [Armatimonadota bacterium]
MAVTFDELKTTMEGTRLKFISDPDREIIWVSVSGFNGVHHLLLKRVENGEGLLLRVPSLATVRGEHPFKTKVLETLLVENHRIKVGRFCYDQSDGEIYLDWFMPLEDGCLTLQQLKRCISALLHLADDLSPRLRHLLETGEDLPSDQIGIRGLLNSLLREGMQRGLLSESDEIQLRRLLMQMEEGEEGSQE